MDNIIYAVESAIECLENDSCRENNLDVSAKIILKDVLKELDKHRWTPVEERPPDEGINFDVADCRIGKTTTGYFIKKSGRWSLHGGGFGFHVTHYRPIILPESETEDAN